MNYSSRQIEDLKQRIFEIHKSIEMMNKDYGRHFTMDGHLLGSAGEVFAKYFYGIELYEASHKTYDGYHGTRQIQVKITQKDSVEVKGDPEYLIVLKIVYSEDNMNVFEVYNGPGFKALDGKVQNSNKERSISLKRLCKIMVDQNERIPNVNEIDKWQG